MQEITYHPINVIKQEGRHLSDTSKEDSTMHRRGGNHNQSAHDVGDGVVNRRADKDPNHAKKNYNRVRVLSSHHRWVCFLVFVIFIVSIQLNLKAKTSGTAVPKSLNSRRIKPDVSKYINCTILKPVASSTIAQKKPLWFPSYPTAMDDNLMRTLISKMTGLSSGAKSFYASQKRIGLRRCQSKTTETAACLNIHPLVEMSSPGPDAFHELFDPTVILLMRNPAIVIPAFLNQKRIKYKKLPGQMPLMEWRKSRDDSLENMWKQWKKQYLSWKNTEHYEIGMYLVYEDLMDPERGTQAITNVSQLLQKAGFATMPNEDMACLWYQTFGGDVLDQYYQYRYD
mmetsp:Transcript_30197/g.46063  ORF Transcript_30197/g.46063 Transcript_30197/m.46063 type:complete len:341 (-) Transcript_30197:238-1260(-)